MTPLLRKVILCSLLMSCWRWGAEEIFRPIAFACPEWIRRLGPYVIPGEIYTRNIQYTDASIDWSLMLYRRNMHQKNKQVKVA